MNAIKSSNYSAVYINHNQLIDTAYRNHVVESSCYQLKPHIFNFRPKHQQNIDTGIKSRKRKSKLSSPSTETLRLKNTCEELLKKLKNATQDFRVTQPSGPIERIWEESTVFPKFRGANTTNQFQKVSLNGREYVIPPLCEFFNHDVRNINEISPCMASFDFVVMDPPWRNKYIRRIKRIKQELGYEMLSHDLLSDTPLDKLIHSNSIVAIWCTNSLQHQLKIVNEFLPRWDLCLLHKIVWLKLNTDGDLVGDINEDCKKQPYEALFIARHKDCQKDLKNIQNIEFILSIPSIIHSHKPPILELFRQFLPQNPRCLELFARYLQPGFTSVGMEVVKLMDERLYSEI